jgi:hypothetical protein
MAQISAVKKVKDGGRHIGWSATYGELTQVFPIRRDADYFEKTGKPAPKPGEKPAPKVVKTVEAVEAVEAVEVSLDG